MMGRMKSCMIWPRETLQERIMWRKAVLIGLLALPTSLALAQTPDGSGDPNAISCRPPQALPGSRLRGPEVCKTNAVWARYRKDGMDVAADGIHDVPSEKWRSINPQACHPVTMGGSGTTNATQTNFSMLCE
jgi:hypothetical protein